HFYYMCTKYFNDGDVHAYFSPYESPYDAYIAFMNALSDLQLRITHALEQQASEQHTELEQSSQSLWQRLVAWWRRRFEAIVEFFKSPSFQ
ncbi:hypothetical protein N9L26_01530, partial [Candidatus Pacebacteria bacterium]|nr:hypothetical protein [Candidatus Paceibacterota bacterium]